MTKVVTDPLNHVDKVMGRYEKEPEGTTGGTNKTKDPTVAPTVNPTDEDNFGKGNNSDYLLEGTIISYKEGKLTKDYEVLEQIGAGGFARTYKVKSLGHTECEILKEFFPTGARRADNKVIYNKTDKDNKAWEEAFCKEPQRILSIMYPELGDVPFEEIQKHITNNTIKEWDKYNLAIPRSDAFEANGTYYYTMEYINGITVKDLMGILHSDHKTMELDLAFFIVMSICNGLNKLHNGKVRCIHQDISPNNIMLRLNSDGTYTVKIIDYGLATTVQNLDKEEMKKSYIKQAGTDGFTDWANLTVLNDAPAEEKCKLDIYSLGAMLLYMTYFGCETEDETSRHSIPRVSQDINSGRLRWTEPIEQIIAKDKAHLEKSIKMRMVCALVNEAMTPDLKNRIDSVETFMEMLKFIIDMSLEKSMENNGYPTDSQTPLGRFFTVYENEVVPTVLNFLKKEAMKAKLQIQLEALQEENRKLREQLKMNDIVQQEMLKNLEEKHQILEEEVKKRYEARFAELQKKIDELIKKQIPVSPTEPKEPTKPVEPTKPEEPTKPTGPKGPDWKKYTCIALACLLVLGVGFYLTQQGNNNVPAPQVEQVLVEEPEAEPLVASVNEEIKQAMNHPAAIERFLKKVSPDAVVVHRRGELFETVLNMKVEDLFKETNQEYLIGKTYRVVEVTKDDDGLICEIIIAKNQ